jgi:hypothetical protein
LEGKVLVDMYVIALFLSSYFFLNTSIYSSLNIPSSIARGVSRKSEFSARTVSLNSDLAVNIRYGSSAPSLIKSSISTPVKALSLFKVIGYKFYDSLPALMPATKP